MRRLSGGAHLPVNAICERLSSEAAEVALEVPPEEEDTVVKMVNDVLQHCLGTCCAPAFYQVHDVVQRLEKEKGSTEAAKAYVMAAFRAAWLETYEKATFAQLVTHLPEFAIEEGHVWYAMMVPQDQCAKESSLLALPSPNLAPYFPWWTGLKPEDGWCRYDIAQVDLTAGLPQPSGAVPLGLDPKAPPHVTPADCTSPNLDMVKTLFTYYQVQAYSAQVREQLLIEIGNAESAETVDGLSSQITEYFTGVTAQVQPAVLDHEYPVIEAGAACSFDELTLGGVALTDQHGRELTGTENAACKRVCLNLEKTVTEMIKFGNSNSGMMKDDQKEYAMWDRPGWTVAAVKFCDELKLAYMTSEELEQLSTKLLPMTKDQLLALPSFQQNFALAIGTGRHNPKGGKSIKSHYKQLVDNEIKCDGIAADALPPGLERSEGGKRHARQRGPRLPGHAHRSRRADALLVELGRLERLVR